MKNIPKNLTKSAGVLLVIALLFAPFPFGPFPIEEAEAAVSNVRQEINIIDAIVSAAGDDSAIVQLDRAKYSGTKTYYFEVVGKVTSGTLTVALERVNTGTQDATISVTETSFTRKRSTAFTPPAGATQYNINLSGGTGTQVQSARIIILQNFAGDANSNATSTQTQIEIGNKETGKTNTTNSALSNPKYWKYNSANWNGTVSVTAEASFKTGAQIASTTTYGVSATTTTTYYTYIGSKGVSYVQVEAWGAGGGSGGGASGGGGGGGGAYARGTTTVAQGSVNILGVGGGQPDGTAAVAASSTYTGANGAIIRAAGGTGVSGATGGAGGTTASSIGDVKFNGGAGGNGNGTGDVGGGGGGAGGPGGAGITASNAGANAPTAGGRGNNNLGGVGGAAGTTNNDTCSTTQGSPGNDHATGGGGGGGAGGDGTGVCNGGNGGKPGGGAGGSDAGPNEEGAQGQIILTETHGAVGIAIEEDNGSFGGWTFKAQIVVDGAATSTASTTRSASFTPTDGRHYRLVASTTNSGVSYDIYNAKIIVDQTSTEGFTKLEPQYLLANTGSFGGSTGLKDFDTLFDPADWTGSTNTYYHEANGVSSGTGDLKLQSDPNGTPADITGSTITDTVEVEQSSSLTMPGSSQTLDVNVTGTGTLNASRILVQATLPNLWTLTQRDYIFLNDDQGDVDSYTKSHSAATSTSISNVKKGERLVARIQLDNTGTATSTAAYRLQWENNTDAAGTWNDVGTTTQIRWSLSEKGALGGRPGQVPLPTKQVTTSCSASTAYQQGRFVAGTGTTTAFGIGPSKCAEIAYVIETSGATAGKTYRLRVIDGTNNATFTTYSAYPTFSIESPETLRYSKEARGAAATSTLVTPNNIGPYNTITIGTDGFPVATYFDNTGDDLEFVKCGNASCSSGNTLVTLDSNVDINVGQSSLAIGIDGYPVISYHDDTNDLGFIKCQNASCSSITGPTKLDSANVVGRQSSIAIGTDGYPVIAYYDDTGDDLKFIKCENASCSSITGPTILDSSINASDAYVSIAIGIDGYPVMSYYDDTQDLGFIKCGNASCSSITGPTKLDTANDTGRHTYITIGTDGYPAISYLNFTNADLMFIKCENASCSSITGPTIIDSSVDTTDKATALAIGVDGYPVLAYYDGPQDLGVYKCANITCTSGTSSTPDTASTNGDHASIAIGTDGYPVIAYFAASPAFDFMFAKCSSLDCSPDSSTVSSNLSSTSSDLRFYLDDGGYTNVGTSNNLYDSLSAATSTKLAYVFKKTNATADLIDVSWEGQVSVSTTTSLQIFNYTSGLWETLQTNDTPIASTDFTLTGSKTTALSDYYSSNVVAARVVTGTTTAPTIFKTDNIAITFTPNVSTFTQSGYRFFENNNGTQVGGNFPLADANATTTLTSSDQQFRLRSLIHISGTQLGVSGENFKLQYVDKGSGTWCGSPSGGTPSTWTDVTSSTLLAYYNNATPADGATLTASTTDPTHAGDSIVAQTYEELNNFTNSQGAIPAGQDGKWDFSLYDNGAPGNTTYCLRMVKSDGTAFTTYEQYPAVVTGTITLDQLHYRWRNPNGSESSTAFDASEDTALSEGVYLGDSKRLRFLVKNTGTGTAKDHTFRLEVASSTDSYNFWTAVPSIGSQTTEHWKMNLTTGYSDGDATTDNSGLTNPSGTFVAGKALSTNNQTTALTLLNSRFTELEYSIVSTSYAATGITYRFRLTNAGSTSNFSYTVNPQITLSSQARPQFGGGGVGTEGSGSGSQQSGGGAGGGGGTEPSPPPPPPVGGGGSGGGGGLE